MPRYDQVECPNCKGKYWMLLTPQTEVDSTGTKLKVVFECSDCGHVFTGLYHPYAVGNK